MDQYEDYSFCRAQMGPDEHVLWQGKPDKGNLFTKQDLLRLPGTLVFLGITIFISAGSAKGGIRNFLMFLPFLVIVGFIFLGPIVRLIRNRKNSLYVITNKKIYRKIGNKVDYLASASMPSHYTYLYKNGNGSIYFQNAPATYDQIHYGNSHRGPASNSVYFSLENLADIRRAESALEQMDH